MELRHLRCFVALAEELHFTRAAERLHIEQPPLSRAIKELEDDLGVVLFERNRRGTVLTEAGATFLKDVRRVFAVLKQAQENVRAVAAGLSGSLRIAVSDGAIDPRLSALLARCREEEPEIEIRLSEVPLADQLRGLRSGDFSIGFAHTAEVGDGIVTEPLWHDPLVVAVPARHPLLSHKAVPLHQLASYPLVLCDPQVCEGYHRELARLLRPLERPPDVAEHVSSLDMMLTLVGAGYGVGFITETRIAASLRPDVVIRPLAMDSAVITTYLLRPAGEDSPVSVERFIARLRAHSDD
ncbi:TPA: LysR family transcriptional regulator [Pseudomonas aeruginosa C40A]|jgi:DNA-binding transcriptional LysR family regulator|uniref:Aromatic hydrocarbon utilization transcriptional regulator CatR n=3 Tax=Pseudomonadota TaxID=1224 RepID=A0A894X856_PSEAI|nr:MULTISPECIES: LysR family transcriptional regulator [Pseudomonadota]HCB1661551.1 LysR family transcriptional regulator [Citrobacter farmeri]HCK7207979.1 LysR family transcriptional regulator [Enterobacter hormaechei]HCL2591836.1 LysR family transcriptional regulator [Pseudomonas aeruginosa C40A]EIU5019184.1 LysR family transcriptional regulator [Pseudomonas aeruginosa]EKM7588553.1 LysR family transcriptional regulator [Pseudomonas aeruginosa]